MTDHDLANRLELMIQWAKPTGEALDDLRFAAARLRHLDALLTAIGDPDELLAHELDMSDGILNMPEVTHEIVRDILRRIADAATNSET